MHPINLLAKTNQLGYYQNMEKRVAHYKLVVVKQLVAERKVSFTKTALEGAANLGFDAEEILDVVSNLTGMDLYKSMTSHADHTVWHDVYRVQTDNGQVYLKLTILENLLIVSFKEL